MSKLTHEELHLDNLYADFVEALQNDDFEKCESLVAEMDQYGISKYKVADLNQDIENQKLQLAAFEQDWDTYYSITE